jgi:hypothetical protein
MRIQHPSGSVGAKYDWVAAYHNYFLSQSHYREHSDLYVAGAPARTFTPFA